ncbi:MAG: Spy/CpxP family protein refolding chaperone [Gammaproteobacteria bacterium]|nr:Spy/CpxP family protein refolding chaperone [Gammaproteobacteria bacterium]
MKKRNILVAAAILSVVGSGLVFAGVANCRHSGKTHLGAHGAHKMERLIGKMDRYLDLSDAQELSLEKILEQNRSVVLNTRHADRSFYLDMMALGLSADDFDGAANELAEERTEQLKHGAVEIARFAKQVSEVLTEEQKQEALDLIQKRRGAWSLPASM